VITYAERACFHRSHVRALERAQIFVAHLSDAWGNELRCHELVRALQSVMSNNTLVVVDGHCGMVEHSWLRFSDGVILDAYAPGRLPSVQIIDGGQIVAFAYRAGEARCDIRRSVVDRIVAEMRGREPVRES
jgi:hypothetical protein